MRRVFLIALTYCGILAALADDEDTALRDLTLGNHRFTAAVYKVIQNLYIYWSPSYLTTQFSSNPHGEKLYYTYLIAAKSLYIKTTTISGTKNKVSNQDIAELIKNSRKIFIVLLFVGML